jgi:hypothetical protein
LVGADFAAGFAVDALDERVDVAVACLLAATYDLSPRVHTDGRSRCFDCRREDAGWVGSQAVCLLAQLSSPVRAQFPRAIVLRVSIGAT